MNKLGKCIILLILLVIMTAIIFISLKDDSVSEVAKKDVNDDETYNYILYSSADYIATKPEEIYQYADLVIVGNYKNINKCYIGNIQAVVTEAVFNVKNVVKGNYNGNEIKINYYGGTVSLEEYVKSLSEEQIKKRELNGLTDKQIKSGTVSYDVGKSKVDINNNVNSRNDDYLIFLSYDKESDIYFVLADGYGMRKISNDNKIFNLDTNSYDINLNELNRSKK